MSPAVASALSAVIAAIATALIAAYVGHRRRVQAEREGQYDSELRQLRLAAYKELWSLMEPLATYAREPASPDRASLEALSKALRSWYFKTGGLYLSNEARTAYFQFQRTLWTIASSDRWEADRLEDDDLDRLRELGSWLRTVLTYDVGTRRRFSLARGWAPEDREAKLRAEGHAEALEQRWN